MDGGQAHLQAEAFLGHEGQLHMYGQSNVLSISEVQQQVEEAQSGTKTLSSAELAVKSMSDQAKRLTDQAKQMSARQALAKTQKGMLKASHI